MSKRGPAQRPLPHGLTILHEDDDIIVVNKPGGLLTMGTDKEAQRTAYWALMDHVRAGNAQSRNRIFIVHRLDRETSGVLLFAKSEAVKRRLQEGWQEARKTYLAVVQGHPAEDSGIIQTYLAETTALRVYTTDDPTRGALARTAWRVLRRTPRLTLLQVDLLTGRKHQIRVHLAHLGHPVVGDNKYDKPTNTEGRPDGERRGEPAAPLHQAPNLALHAWRLTVPHPHTGEAMTFEAPLSRAIAAHIGGTTVPEPGSAGARERAAAGLGSGTDAGHGAGTVQHPGPGAAAAGAHPGGTGEGMTLHPTVPVPHPDFKILTVTRRGKVHKRSNDVPLPQVLCRLLYPAGAYIHHKTKQPYAGPWPEGFDPQNPPAPKNWTLPWPPPGE